jgi:hypothetical protein
MESDLRREPPARFEGAAPIDLAEAHLAGPAYLPGPLPTGG